MTLLSVYPSVYLTLIVVRRLMRSPFSLCSSVFNFVYYEITLLSVCQCAPLPHRC
jgi:hypothetical protein